MKKSLLYFGLVSVFGYAFTYDVSAKSFSATVCGPMEDYGDSFAVINHGKTYFIPGDNTAPKDPHNVVKVLVRLQKQGLSACVCVAGKFVAFQRVNETAYRFTRLDSARACNKK